MRHRGTDTTNLAVTADAIVGEQCVLDMPTTAHRTQEFEV